MQESNTSPYLTPTKTPPEEMNTALRLLDIERRARRESYVLVNTSNPELKRRKIGRVLFFPIDDLENEPTKYGNDGRRTETSTSTMNETVGGQRLVRRLPPLKRKDNNVLNWNLVGEPFTDSTSMKPKNNGPLENHI